MRTLGAGRPPRALPRPAAPARSSRWAPGAARVPRPDPTSCWRTAQSSPECISGGESFSAAPQRRNALSLFPPAPCSPLGPAALSWAVVPLFLLVLMLGSRCWTRVFWKRFPKRATPELVRIPHSALDLGAFQKAMLLPEHPALSFNLLLCPGQRLQEVSWGGK